MELAVGLYLAACAAAGFGLTYASGVGLNLEERIAFGVVLGGVAVSAVTFAFSMAAGDVTSATTLGGLAVALAASGLVLFRTRSILVADAADSKRRWFASIGSAGHPWPVLAVGLVCGAWTVHFFHQAYVYMPDGLYAGYVNIWGDWAAHLSFASSFAYGHNFPPQYSIDPGHRLGYPFMIDFFAADLTPLGAPITAALVATSAYLGLAFPVVLYLVARRFTGGRFAASIAVFVFLLSGGLGFVYLVGDVQRNGLSALTHLVREYTLNRDINFQWLNPVLAYLVPQRSTLFGFSLALIVLAIIWIAHRDRAGWRSFLFAGLLTGIMPVFHVHAYGTAVALTGIWFAFVRRREWLAFFVPALVIGVPILAWMWPPANTSYCSPQPSLFGYCIEPGWLSYTDTARDGAVWFGRDVIWFWIKNTALLIPLLLVGALAWRRLSTDYGRWYAPMWLWFLVPNVIVLQPWDWDNTKFFIFWALLGSILVGQVLAWAFHRGGALAAVASLSIVVLCLAGALDVTRASDFSVSAVQFTDAKGLQVADWVRNNTSPTATFAVADEHNNPIPTLTGRKELIGYAGWLWTYGLSDFDQKGADLKRVLDGDPATPALVAQYGIDYVMIGPQELDRGASRAYWDEHGTLVYDNGEYSVYRTNRA